MTDLALAKEIADAMQLLNHVRINPHVKLPEWAAENLERAAVRLESVRIALRTR